MGQVRIPVTIDKAEQAIRELKNVSKGIAGLGTDAKKSTYALEEIGKSFTPFRRNLEVVNQLRSAFNMAAQAVRVTASAVAALAESTPRTAAALGRVRVATSGLVSEFTHGLDTGGRFSGVLNALSGDMTGTADAARTLGDGIGNLIVGLEGLNRVAGILQTGGLSAVLGLIRASAMAGTENIERYLNTNPTDRGTEASRNFAFNPNAGLSSEELTRPGAGRGDQGSGSSRWGDTSTSSRRSGGGRGASEFFSEAGASGGAAAALGTETAIAEQYAAQAEALREVFANLDAIAALEQRRLDAASLSREVEREQADKSKEQLTQQMEIEQELAARREEWSSGFIASVGSIANAAQNLGKSVASAYEAMGGSSEKAKKVEGAFVVAYSSVMAALELAESIRAFAKQDYVSGALHLVGMAAYIAAAVEAGSQLGGGAAKTPSAQTSYQAARTEGLGAPSGEQEGKTIVNQYSWGRSRGEAAEAVADIEYEGARTGRVRRADASVWGA